MSAPATKQSAKGSSSSDHNPYASLFVENNDASATREEPAPALDGAPGAPAGRKILPQRRTRPLTHENLQPLSYDLHRRPLPSDSKPLYEPQMTRPEAEPEILLQPETRPISHEQLVVEVEAIYAGLVMVEAKCIDIDERQSAAAQEKDQSKRGLLNNDQWPSPIALHKQLLHEHHNFSLACPGLSRLAGNESTEEAPKFEMPEPPDESLDKISVDYLLFENHFSASQYLFASPGWSRLAGNESTKEAPTLEMPEPPDESLDKISWTDMQFELEFLALKYLFASPGWCRLAGNESTKEAPKLEMPEPPDESPDKISWMDHVLLYAMVKATEPAGDGKRELKNVAVVRDALGDNVQEPSRLKSSPTRKYLPMILKGKEIGARHDTGAEGSNFITSKLAEGLKLHIRTEKSDRKSFSMGTGMVRRAIGRVRASCAFAKESGTKMKCWFYVLPKLASPLIMGSQFLRDTKTMSHFTDRLEDHFPCTSPVPMVNLISSTRQAKRRLAAFIDGRHTYINADSGSHLDLMSSAYVKKYRYKLDRRRDCRKRVQLADATVADTIGQVKAELTLPDGSTFSKTFDVLPGLTSEVLIGEDTLAKLNVFTEHESSFMDVLGGERHLELSILSHLGRLNGFLARTLNLSNRRSQAEHQCEPSLGGSLEIGTDVNFLASLAKQQDDKMMRALHEQDLEAERLQHEKKRLEASGAALKKAKRHGAEQAPEPATQPPAPQSPSVSTIS